MASCGVQALCGLSSVVKSYDISGACEAFALVISNPKAPYGSGGCISNLGLLGSGLLGLERRGVGDAKKRTHLGLKPPYLCDLGLTYRV